MSKTIDRICETLGQPKPVVIKQYKSNCKQVKKGYGYDNHDKMIVHHLIPKSIHPYGYLDIENMLPLTMDIEKPLHKFYSRYELAMDPLMPIIKTIEFELLASK
ncbi:MULTISPECIES: hypothetical protein [Methanobacterium]|nr:MULTISPECIES: hypothetical protein [Methanobacterium]